MTNEKKDIFLAEKVNVEVFEHTEFGNLTTFMIDGDVWFLGNEVAVALGYKKPSNAIKRHVDDEDLLTLKYSDCPEMGFLNKDIIWVNGDRTPKTLINESGLYSLIMTSQLPGAREYKRWVTSEVLPTIRKTGSYELQPKSDLEIIAEGYKKALELAREQQQIIESQKIELQEARPKTEYYDLVLSCKNAVTITTIAKDYGMSGQSMNSKLHELGIQYKQSGTWFLYQKYANLGYTSTETYVYDEDSDIPKARVNTKWTQKGRLFIYETLKEEGILPLIEQD